MLTLILYPRQLLFLFYLFITSFSPSSCVKMNSSKSELWDLPELHPEQRPGPPPTPSPPVRRHIHTDGHTNAYTHTVMTECVCEFDPQRREVPDQTRALQERISSTNAALRSCVCVCVCDEFLCVIYFSGCQVRCGSLSCFCRMGSGYKEILRFKSLFYVLMFPFSYIFIFSCLHVPMIPEDVF